MSRSGLARAEEEEEAYTIREIFCWEEYVVRWINGQKYHFRNPGTQIRPEIQ